MATLYEYFLKDGAQNLTHQVTCEFRHKETNEKLGDINVKLALAKLHERMQPAMLRLVEGIEKQEGKS
jgi:hypothetical protein